MTSTINTTTTLPRSPAGRRPSVAKVAVAGAAAAFTLLGITIAQSGNDAPTQASNAVATVAAAPPASLATESTPELLAAWAARYAQAQAATATAATATAPAAAAGPNFEQPSTWAEWSVNPAPAATGDTVPANVR